MDDFVLQWNKNFPVDYWWRKKYGIPFGSKKHQEVSLFGIIVEYKEEKLYEKALEDKQEFERRQKEYKETGIFLEEEIYSEVNSEKELDDFFKGFNIESLQNE